MKALIILSMVLSATASYARCNRDGIQTEKTLFSKDSNIQQQVQKAKPAERKNNLDRQSKRD